MTLASSATIESVEEERGANANGVAGAKADVDAITDKRRNALGRNFMIKGKAEDIM
jgi:hypothetical protein